MVQFNVKQSNWIWQVLLIFSAIFAPSLYVSAEDLSCDYEGIHFSLDTQTHEATALSLVDENDSRTTLEFPSQIEFKNVKYTVTAIYNFGNAKYSIETIILPSTINNIERSFLNLYKLKNINIPTSVTRLYRNFYKCYELENIVIPSSITYIYDSFEYCDKLESITFPSSLDSIQYSFCNCPKIKNATFTSSISSIDNSFQYCDGLEELVLPSSEVSIIKSFEYCYNLKKISFPSIASSISKSFTNCNELESIVLPSKVDNIDNSFSNCEKLKNIVFPDSLRSITGETFSYNPSLESINISSHTGFIGGKAFNGNTNLKSVVIADTDTIGSLTQDPIKYSWGYPVFDGPFCGNPVLEEVVFPESLTLIGDRVFEGSKLKTLILPPRLKRIGQQAFCLPSLESIVFPDSLEYIGSDSFCNLTMETLVFPPNVKDRGRAIFTSCNGLKTVIFPEKCERIPQGVFNQSKTLEKIVFPKSLKTIGRRAFQRDSSIRNLVFPPALESIEQSAFRYSPLGPITIPESVKWIGYQAFLGSQIGTLTIERSDSTLYFKSEFDYYDPEAGGWPTSQFTDANVSKLILGRPIFISTYYVWNPFETITSLVVMDDTDLGDFMNYPSWRDPDKLPYEITLGCNVKNFKEDCTDLIKLKSLTMMDPVPPECPVFSKEQFDTLQVYVPEEGFEAYRTAEGWKNFVCLKATDVEEIEMPISNERTVVARFDLQGRPVKEGYEGIVIVHYSDGTVRKELAR